MSLRQCILWLLVCACMPILGASVTVTSTTLAQFDACTRDSGIDVRTAPGAAVLAPVDYHGMEMGLTYGKASDDPAFWGKKIFHLQHAGSAGAKLFVFRKVEKATFNGAPLSFVLQGYGNYYVADIHPNLLREGANEFVIHDPVCRTLVDIRATPSRNSFVSTDSGVTWQPAKGEFLAQLCLYRHPPRGVITSDVIDLANPERQDIICPQVQVRKLRVLADASTPDGTAVELQARSGGTVRPDAGWTAWMPAAKVKPARFVQWRAILSTTNPTLTPVLEAVQVHADVNTWPARGLMVETFENQRIARSSLDFTYQAPSPKLAYLRTNWKVDQIVAPGKTELEKFLLLRNWTRKQWPHNEGSCTRPWDAVNILTAPEGDHGMCGHFAVVFKQCALSLGYNARKLGLAHHGVCEIWSKQYRKWIVIDVESVQKEGWKRYGTSIYVDKTTRIPLGAMDLHQAWKSGDTSQIVQLYAMTDENGDYQVHERVYPRKEYDNYAIFMYPPRNNHLDQQEPWEYAAGNDYLHSNSYYWWSDGPYPDCAEWSQFTTREADMNLTLEQAAVTLTATRSSAKLAVAVDTVTPNFEAFRYRINGGAWQTLPGSAEDAISAHGQFIWSLTPGQNTLEILPRNLFGMDGIPTKVTVVKQ